MGWLRTKDFLIHTGPEKWTETTVRIDGNHLVVNEPIPEVWAKDSNGNIRKDYKGDKIKGDPISEILPAAWVKVVDGWEKDGNWGGYLQVTSECDKGKWIDSSAGWVVTVSSKADPVTFIDKDDYYEIWQHNKPDSSRPLTIVNGNRLRFVEGAEPARFNVFDSTH